MKLMKVLNNFVLLKQRFTYFFFSVLRKISAGVPKCELSVVTNKNFVQLQQ